MSLEGISWVLAMSSAFWFQIALREETRTPTQLRWALAGVVALIGSVAVRLWHYLA